MAVLALGSAPGASAQDIDSLMATMSTRRKVAQLFMPDVYAFEDKGDDAKYLEWVDEGIGGEWGMSMRFAEFPLWPRQMQLGALKDEDLVYRMGRQSLQLRRGSSCPLRPDAFRRCPPCLRRWPFRRLRREMT